MKKYFRPSSRRLLIFFLCAFLITPGKTQASDLSEEMLRLFQSTNRNLSLGAMLIADQVLDSGGRLEAYVKASLKDSDPPLDRLVKLYCLSRMDSDFLPAFFGAFPEDPELFREVLLFDSSLTRSVSGVMVQYLVELTDCRAAGGIRAMARVKAERLQEVQNLSGWSAEVFPAQYEECRKP